MSDITPSDIAEAVEFFEQADQVLRRFANAKKAADLLRSFTTAKGELDAAIASKRAEIDKLNRETVDAAVAEGRRRAAAIIEQAHKDGQAVVDKAKAEAAEIAALAEQKRAEHDELHSKIAGLRKAAATLAGA